MRWLLNLLGIAKVVGQRQRSYLGLVLARLAGFVVAIAIVVSIPLYSDAVGYRVLRTELEPDEDGTTRPPFAYLFSRFATEGPVSVDAYRKVDEYFSKSVANDIGLPTELAVRYATTDKLRLLPLGNKQYKVDEQLDFVSVGFASGVESQVEITDGALPKPVTDTKAPAEVMIHERLAAQLGMQTGEDYIARKPDGSVQVQMRVAGVWRARNELAPYWFIRPASFEDVVLLPEPSFQSRILPRKEPIYQAVWYMVLDGNGVRSRHVPALIDRSESATMRADEILPETRLRVSPLPALEEHYRQVRLLTLSLLVFALPILGLIGYFIIMITGMVVQRQQNEIAVFHSRGASRTEVMGIYLLEGLGLGVLSLVLGVLLGRYTALLMGWTRSFLQFAPRSDVAIKLSPESLQGGLLVVTLTLVASLLPAFGAAGMTIVSYKRERARSIHKPLWQRLYLDFILLGIAYLGYRQLRDRGTISIVGRGNTVGDPFSSPLLILTPALWLLALALLSIRLFPVLMGGVGNIVARWRGVSSLLALRYLTRTPRAYTSPVLLLVLTLSLATFTASMAKTLDSHLNDQVLYDVGAQMRLTDLGESTGENESTGGATGGGAPGEGGEGQQGAAAEEPEGAKYLFLPVTEYLKIPGVTGATRVSRSEANAVAGRNSEAGTVLGLDRMDFAEVGAWRGDYAPASLGSLMNALALREDGLLASRAFLEKNNLDVGEKVTLQMRDLEAAKNVSFVISGVLDYFPTLYPEDGPFFVANLDYIFSAQGGEFPYEVWLNTRPSTSRQQVELGITKLDLRSIVSDVSLPQIIIAQDRPERQGLYGLLSVGFLASAMLTGLGFLFYSVVSFQRRYIELGMLRAIGLSTRQMAVLLIWEQALIIGMGIFAGTVLGVGVSGFFIPFLQVRTGAHPQTPPFQVLLAWDQIRLIYLIFAVLLGLALLAVAVLLLRLQIFRAVKLGEAT